MKKYILLLIIAVCAGCASNKDSYNFEKVVFNTSRCFGICPVYHLQVNADRSFLLERETSDRNPSIRAADSETLTSEYFKGIVPESEFHALVQELKMLDTLKITTPNCCDGSIKTIAVYHDKKYVFVETMFPPDEMQPMLTKLLAICTMENLQKTEKFVITQITKETEKE